MGVRGTDWSHWNEHPDPGPYEFIIHKATQGTVFRDSAYPERAQWIRGLGKMWGAYLFPNIGEEPAHQVAYFARYADIQPGDMVALDFESDGTWSNHTNRDLANVGAECMQRLIAAYPRNRVLLYCNRSAYYNIVQPYDVPRGDGLWIASPGVEPTMPWIMWQYGNGSVDYDRADFPTADTMRRWTLKRSQPPEDELSAESDRKIQIAHAQLVGDETGGANTPVDHYPGWPEKDDLADFTGPKTQVDYLRTVLALQRETRGTLDRIVGMLDELRTRGIPVSAHGTLVFQPDEPAPATGGNPFL